MRVLVFESNLMWSARFVRTLTALGHEAAVRTTMPEFDEQADAAIVNLGEGPLPVVPLVERLRELGIRTIGHAGHREKELHELGRQAGCDVLATNREITMKMGEIIGH